MRIETYRIWLDMMHSCLDHRYDKWQEVGRKGITIAERWLDFSTFLRDMGQRPQGAVIKRYSPKIGFEKGNCYWGYTD
jgi:hypothetical protein